MNFGYPWDLVYAAAVGLCFAYAVSGLLRLWLYEEQEEPVRLLRTPVLDVVDHVEPLGMAETYEGDIEVV